MVRVLVVEDEANIREMIALNLRLTGMEAVEAESAEAALPLLACRIVVTRSEEVEALCNAQGVPVLRHAQPYHSDTVRLGLAALLGKEPALRGCLFLPGPSLHIPLYPSKKNKIFPVPLLKTLFNRLNLLKRLN